MVAHIVHTEPLPKGKGIEGSRHVETVQAKYFGGSFHTETHSGGSLKSDLSYICFFTILLCLHQARGSRMRLGNIMRFLILDIRWVRIISFTSRPF
jgi:hypothetical protein